MASTSTLVQYITGLDFPTNRQRLIYHAQFKNAPQEIIEALKRLPDKEYKSISEFWDIAAQTSE